MASSISLVKSGAEVVAESILAVGNNDKFKKMLNTGFDEKIDWVALVQPGVGV